MAERKAELLKHDPTFFNNDYPLTAMQIKDKHPQIFQNCLHLVGTLQSESTAESHISLLNCICQSNRSRMSLSTINDRFTIFQHCPSPATLNKTMLPKIRTKLSFRMKQRRFTAISKRRRQISKYANFSLIK